MTAVWSPDELDNALQRTRRSAERSFGSDAIYVEKLIEHARHVEVQILADTSGTVIDLGDRDCSVQRRYQKVIEEAPAPNVEPALRARMIESAIAAAASIGYTGAGTVEFLLSPSGDFFFLEMNTRLQVEHPVTEQVTGIDLVEWQLRIAAGEKVDVLRPVQFSGHSVQCRIYAEDPQTHQPSPGLITVWRIPRLANIRLDAGVAEGSLITQHYDPLLAKLISWGPDRETAIATLLQAIDRSSVTGIATNLPLLADLLRSGAYRNGRFTTDMPIRVRGDLTQSVLSERS